jgi:hypothetical protein
MPASTPIGIVRAHVPLERRESATSDDGIDLGQSQRAPGGDSRDAGCDGQGRRAEGVDTVPKSINQCDRDRKAGCIVDDIIRRCAAENPPRVGHASRISP